MKRSLLAFVLAVAQVCTPLVQAQTRAPTAAEEEAANKAIARFNQQAGKVTAGEASAADSATQKFNAQNQAPTADAIKKARELASQGAQTGRTQAGRIDADGNIVQEGGNASRSMATSDSLKDQGRYLQGAMGVDGVETIAQPAKGQGAGATTAVRGQLDLSCAMEPGQVRSAKGVQVRFDGCAGQSKQVEMKVAVCVSPLFRATTCGANSFTGLALTDGAYTSGPEGVKFGLGCNSSKVCTVSFSASLTIAGTGAQIQQQADQQHAAAMQDDNSLVKGIGQVYGSQEFADQQSSQKPVDIVQVLEGATKAGATCTATNNCLKKVTTEHAYTRTCERSFLLTERTQTSKLDSRYTATCTQERGSYYGYTIPGYVYSDSCLERVGQDQGEAGYVYSGEVINHREGMVEIGKKLIHACSIGEWKDGCTTDTWEVYFADVSKYEKVNPTYAPLELSKANPVCDERPAGKTNMCLDPSNWFGRTKTAAECMAPNEATQDDGNLSYADEGGDGCGICLEQSSSSTCYGEPTTDAPADSCSGVDLQGCALQTATPLTFSDEMAGLVTSQRETYSCKRTTQYCEQYEARNEKGETCNVSDPKVTANTFGIENVPKEKSDPDAFAQAAASVAVAEELGKGLQDASSNTPQLMPQLFAGKDMRCEFPTSSLLGAGNLLSKNCCRTDLERPKKGVLIQSGCAEKEVELASARRQNYNHFVGEYCSKKGLFGKCLTKTQVHCTYNGMFPRIIAEQGRTQLNNLVAGGSVQSTQQGKLAYDFYSPSDAGSWTNLVTVNGVKLAAYQWPKFCANAEAAAQRQTQDPDGPQCPGILHTWIAGCDANNCGPLPASPELSGEGWAISNVDPLSKLTVATSRYSVVRGACDSSSAKCTYDIYAWPIGQGGKVVMTKDVTFPIWDSSPQVANDVGTLGISANPKMVMGQQQNVADVFYRPYSYTGAPGRTLPTTVRIDFSTDGGTAVWTTANVPTSINGEYSVPGSDLKLSGSCDVTLNACRFRLVGTVTVEPKGWGSCGGRSCSPDCSGFTAGQIAALDFGKMDLSEWLNDVVSKQAPDTGNLAQRLAESTKRQVDAASPTSGGQIATQSSGSAPYAIVTPGEGYGPFTVTLAAGGYWPGSPEALPGVATERVKSVMVKWGDCGVATPLPVVTSINGQPAYGFRASHNYKSPNDSSYASCNLAREANLDHLIELTVLTEKGATYRTNLTVRNVWSNYRGAQGNVATPPTGP